MVNNKTTADCYYLLQDKGKSAVRTSKKLRNTMCDQSSENFGENLEGELSDKGCQGMEDDPLSIFQPYRHKWSYDEESVVQSLFKDNIEAKRVSNHEVRAAVKDHPLLGTISPTKIRDKIRTYFVEYRDMDGDAPVPPEEESAEVGTIRCYD